MTGVAGEKPTKKPARLQHVVAHVSENIPGVYDEVLVFGQEIDALRSILGKPDWVYAAVPHGASFVEALKSPLDEIEKQFGAKS